MRRSIFISTLALTLLLPTAAAAQSHKDSPNIEARLWCPSHIEDLYRELTASEQVLTDEGKWLSVPAGYLPGGPVDDAASWQQNQDDRRATIAVWDNIDERFWDNIFERRRAEADIMRRVAYGILTNWPRAAPRDDTGRQGLHYPLAEFDARGGLQGLRTAGPGLLRATWARWKNERKEFLKSLWGVTASNAFNSEYAKWERVWGPDPPEVPATVPDGYVGEVFDCTWYVSVEYGFLTDSTLGHGLRYYAAFAHEGHLFDAKWDSTNTRVASHFAAEGKMQRAPYPTEMMFVFPWSQSAPFLVEDIARYTAPPAQLRRSRMRPRELGGGGPSDPEVVYDVRYPLWDAEHGVWRFADAVVSSSPGPEFRRTLDRILEIKGTGLQAGEKMRAFAGDYVSEGQVIRQR